MDEVKDSPADLTAPIDAGSGTSTSDQRRDWEPPALRELPLLATSAGGGAGPDAEGPS